MASTSMNQVQRNHVVERIKGAADSARNRVREKYTSKAVTLTTEQKIALIKAGKVKLRKDAELDRYHNGVYLFDFSAQEKPAVLSTAGKTKITSIDKAEKTAIDKAILSGVDEVLASLASFDEAMAKM